MKQLLFIKFLIMALLLKLSAQEKGQFIRGLITDKVSEKPISGVTVSVDGLSLKTSSLSNGNYVLKQVPLGRVKLIFSAVGYEPVIIPEVLVTSGKEVIVDVAMEQKITQLEDVQVVATKTKKGNVSNEFAGSSGRSFSVDEITRYAGGRNDPSKLVSNFAGVVSNNDSRNDIVVRGNSPAGVLWRIEGLPSPNPNHYSTLGATGGPISMLNTNALKTSDFYSGAFPAEFGNATAAVFDISLRTGNSQKHEKTVQLNLFSGLEVMLEGPLSKKKNGSSYLFGYRYSFAQIGQSFGINVGTKAVPKYQDWVYNIQFNKGKWGKLSLFGIGGISNIDFIGKDLDTTDFYSRKDQDTYARIYTLMFGAKHTIDISKSTFIRTTASYSINSTEYQAYQYETPVPPYGTRWLTTNVNDKQNTFRMNSFINTKFNAKLSFRAGFTAEQYNLNTFSEEREGKPQNAAFNVTRNSDNNFLLLQLYAQTKYRITEKWSASVGLNYITNQLNKTQAFNPRVAVNYNMNKAHTLSASYGLQSQMQPLPVYFYTDTTSSAVNKNLNRSLDFTKAHHYVLGYEWRFNTNWRFKAELYYQYIFNIPVETKPSGFSMINSGADFAFPAKTNLTNTGTGTNAGIELTLERFLHKGYYVLITGSVFDSKYKGSDEIERNSTFNYKYAANILLGKEWKMGKKNAFTADIKVTTIGGRYATPVDVAASLLNKRETLDETQFNALKLNGYFRLDTKFGFRLNNSNKKISHTFYLDLQNVTNQQNIFLRRFNPLKGTVGDVYQIGFFPDILYRLQF